MKKLLRSQIVGIIIGLLIASPAIVFATVTILAGQVDYTPRDNTWNVEDVESALDELYDMARNNGGNTSGFIGYAFNYDYTGAVQTFDVPATGEYKIELWGASGGSMSCDGWTGIGGNGGYSSGVIDLSKGDQLYVYVGGAGVGYNCKLTTYAGGWNGGGSTTGGASGGGGATDVRLINSTWNNFDSLKSRIIVAAGGGGSNDRQNGGYGGGLTGGIGASGSTSNGGPGTQTSGGIGSNSGSFGVGGGSGVSDGGSGGGGYYGGGKANGAATAGAGGSSFISGHLGCDAIAETSTSSSIIQTNQPNHYSGLVFTNTTIIDGAGYNWTNARGLYVGQPQPNGTTAAGHTGNGFARITYMG